MTHAIEALHLKKTFRDFWHRPRVSAVKDVSFCVSAGSVYGLLGPNGSGKSTSLKMLLGLLHPSDGSIQVLGGNPKDRAIQQRVGYLPEVSTMYRYLTAEETLHFYGSLFDLPINTRTERVQQLLTLVGLSAAGTRPVGEFSRGMNRRLGLAQALINNPDLLILDEPTAGLDPLGCHHVKNLLRCLADAGKTVLIASHLLADIEDICREITILHHGNVIASGTIENLLAEEHSLTWTAKALTPQQQQSLITACKELTGIEPVVRPTRTNLETYFVKSVLAAGQPDKAASTTDSAELQLPAFLQAS
ncbi:MAG: ABC transporter ATP-binding protein [Kiritimatiellia bacterium]